MVEGWKKLNFWKETYPDVERHIRMRIRAGASVLPPSPVVFKSLERTSLEQTRVVLLGQDPYHTPGMANGLAFSVNPAVRNYPPSLRNILREYSDDLGLRPPSSGDLTPWAEKGVLLLNTALTVEAGKPLSHSNIGWERLTYEILNVRKR